MACLQTVRGIENLHQPDTPAESSGSQKGVTSTEDLQKISLQIRGHKVSHSEKSPDADSERALQHNMRVAYKEPYMYHLQA